MKLLRDWSGDSSVIPLRLQDLYALVTGYARAGLEQAFGTTPNYPSASWADRGRTSLWMVLRLTLGLGSSWFAAQCLILSYDLVRVATGGTVAVKGPSSGTVTE
jgi:hypothetical protein